MVATLLYSIAGGMLAVLATARTEQIAWRFLRLVGILAFALSVAPVVWTVRTGVGGSASTIAPAVASGVGAALLVFIAPIGTTTARLFRVVAGLAGAAGIAAACTSSANVSALRGWALATVVSGQVLGAALLGSITVAWLLGHAYLTATRMTIAPLQHFSRMLSWTIAGRIGFLGVSLAAAWMLSPSDPGIFHRLADSWLIALLRIGVGLAAVAVFAYLVVDCVRLRSTQSATGILYFGSVMAYVGELASQQLTQELGWML